LFFLKEYYQQWQQVTSTAKMAQWQPTKHRTNCNKIRPKQGRHREIKEPGQNGAHVHEKIQRTELEKLTKTVAQTEENGDMVAKGARGGQRNWNRHHCWPSWPSWP